LNAHLVDDIARPLARLTRWIDLVLGNARASFLGLVSFVGLLGNLRKCGRAKQE
jgi:hypothetical protein